MPVSVRHYFKPKEYKELYRGHLDLLREEKNKNKNNTRWLKVTMGHLGHSGGQKSSICSKRVKELKKLLLSQAIFVPKSIGFFSFETCYSEHFSPM